MCGGSYQLLNRGSKLTQVVLVSLSLLLPEVCFALLECLGMAACDFGTGSHFAFASKLSAVVDILVMVCE